MSRSHRFLKTLIKNPVKKTVNENQLGDYLKWQ